VNKRKANDTVDALEPIIVGLQDRGYEIVPVSKLIYTEKYSVDKTGLRSNFD
jgi:hypothetical protein